MFIINLSTLSSQFCIYYTIQSLKEVHMYVWHERFFLKVSNTMAVTKILNTSSKTGKAKVKTATPVQSTE